MLIYNKKLIPRRGFLIAKMLDEETRTPGGLLVPQGARRRQPTDEEIAAASSGFGKVLALGPAPIADTGAEFPLDDLVVGDLVQFRFGMGGVPTVVDGVPLLVLPYGALISVVRPGPWDEITREIEADKAMRELAAKSAPTLTPTPTLNLLTKPTPPPAADTAKKKRR